MFGSIRKKRGMESTLVRRNFFQLICVCIHFRFHCRCLLVLLSPFEQKTEVEN